MNTGYCHCCREQTTFRSTEVWLRDHYLCLSCGSIPRNRHLQYILDKNFNGWETLAIHESSPSNAFISNFSKSYSSSFYYDDVNVGEIKNGIRCENLESLTFSDATFDIFVTQDVFEHILNPELAVKEIMRVLKPEGFHIFTAPKYQDLTHSRPRAKCLADGTIEYLEEKQYHGNPISEGESLVTWDYGKDFEGLLTTWAGYPVITHSLVDRNLGIDGDFLEVFVQQKV